MDRRDSLILAGLLALLAVWLVPVAPIGVDQHHDGALLKPAFDVLDGQVLFRDSFTFYGALTTYLHALALKAFPSLLALRLFTVAGYAITLVFFYLTWRMVMPRLLAATACGLFLLFMPIYEYDWRYQYWMLWPWSSAVALMFQSMGLYALFRMIRGPESERWAFLAGLACACVFWCRLPVGVLTAASLVSIAIGLHLAGWSPEGGSRWRTFGWLAAGSAVLHVLMLLPLMLQGALGEWWYQNVVWPFSWSDTVPLTWEQMFTVYTRPDSALWLAAMFVAAALPFLLPASLGARRWWLGGGALVLLLGAAAWLGYLPSVFMLRPGGWTVLLPVAVVAQLLLSLTLVLQGRHPRTPEFSCLSALAIFSLSAVPQYYPLPDPWHILWALGPAFGLGVYAGWRWLRWPAWVWTVVLALALTPPLWTKVRAAQHAHSLPRATIQEPMALRGMQVDPEMAESMAQIAAGLARIERHWPDFPSVLIGIDPLYLCFTRNRTNATPYYVSWQHPRGAEIQQLRWDYIRRVRPVVFFARARWDAVNEFYRGARYVPVLYVPGEAFEIAVPQELADAMGVGTYGLAPARPPVSVSPPP